MQLRQVKERVAKQEEEWSAAYQALKAESEALMRVKEDYKDQAESFRANNDSLEAAISLLQQQLATAEKVCRPLHICNHFQEFWGYHSIVIMVPPG
jgi:predicted  nucleic acid-binding Zn-ribbon protein